jgi:hypothetical protein
MAQNDNRTPAPTEDNRTSEEHSRRAAENAEALKESAQRNEAKAPNTGPVQGLNASAGQASEDTTQAEANQRQIKEDHDALQAQARRVEASAPPETRTDRPRNA